MHGAPLMLDVFLDTKYLEVNRTDMFSALVGLRFWYLPHRIVGSIQCKVLVKVSCDDGNDDDHICDGKDVFHK